MYIYIYIEISAALRVLDQVPTLANVERGKAQITSGWSTRGNNVRIVRDEPGESEHVAMHTRHRENVLELSQGTLNARTASTILANTEVQ